MKKTLAIMVLCLAVSIMVILPAYATVIWEDQILSQFPKPDYMSPIDGNRVDEGMNVARYVSFQENINGVQVPGWFQHQGNNGDRLWVRWGAPLVIEEGEYYIGLRVSIFRGDGEEKKMEYLQRYKLRVDGKEIPLVSSTNPQWFPEGFDTFGRVILLTGEKVYLTRRTLVEASTDKKHMSITHLILWSSDIEQGPIEL